MAINNLLNFFARFD